MGSCCFKRKKDKCEIKNNEKIKKLSQVCQDNNPNFKYYQKEPTKIQTGQTQNYGSFTIIQLQNQVVSQNQKSPKVNQQIQTIQQQDSSSRQLSQSLISHEDSSLSNVLEEVNAFSRVVCNSYQTKQSKENIHQEEYQQKQRPNCLDISKNKSSQKENIFQNVIFQDKELYLKPVRSKDYFLQNQQQSITIPNLIRNIKYGIRNKGNTCYINSALQMIRQIQILDPTFLLNRDSNFSKVLLSFFKKLERNDYDSELEQIIRVSKQKQTHQVSGGDSYLTALVLLSTIADEIDELNYCQNQEKNISEFERTYTLTLSDGLQCSFCKSYLMDHDEIEYLEEINSSLEVQSLEDLQKLDSFYGEQQEKLHCQKCQRTRLFQTNKSIIYYPQYLIISLQDALSSINQKDLFENPLTFINEKYKINHSYDLIGYCTYTGYHYYYTGNYCGKWIMFNDTQVKEVNKSLESVLYLLFKKIQ